MTDITNKNAALTPDEPSDRPSLSVPQPSRWRHIRRSVWGRIFTGLLVGVSVGTPWIFVEAQCGFHLTFLPMLFLGWLIGRALRVSGEILPWHFGLIAAADTLMVCLLLDVGSGCAIYYSQIGYVDDPSPTVLALIPAYWHITHLFSYALACAFAYRSSYDRAPWKSSPSAASPETIAEYAKRIHALSGTVQWPAKRGWPTWAVAGLLGLALVLAGGVAFLPRCRPSVHQLALSPDGDVLAVGWDHFNGNLVWHNLPNNQAVQSRDAAKEQITWSPDGRQVASLRNHGGSKNSPPVAYIHVVERLGSNSKGVLEERNRIFLCLAYSPNGKIVATGCDDGDVLLDTWTPRLFSPQGRLPNKGAVTSLAFSPRTGRLATGLSNGQITLWDMASSQPLWTCQAQNNKVHQLLFSPKEDVLFSTAALDGVVRAWKAADGSLKQSYPVPMNWITSFALSPDGQTLAVAGGYYHQSGEVRLFDVATAQRKQVLTVDTNTVAAVAFAVDGRTLFVGTRPPINPLFGPYRGQVQRWDLATGQQLAPLE